MPRAAASSARPHVTPLAGFIGGLIHPGSSKPTAPNIHTYTHTYNTMWSPAEQTSLPQDDSCPPSYSEICNDPSPAFPKATRKRAPKAAAKQAPEPSSQRYTSLLSAAGPSSLPPPRYESVIPNQRIKPPTEPLKTPWLTRLRVPHASASTKPPPQPEGVLLELVVDRFGNRKREIKPVRSRIERIQDRAHNGTTFQLSSYYLSKML